jgi:5'-nucleotidase
VSGTPVDCVYLGVLELLPRRPDLIVAGINHGVNLGSDIFYSGTVAAAIEGAIRGVPAVAFSREWETSPDLGPAIGFARALVAALLVEGLPPNTLLNVNVPCSVPRGYSVTRLGRRVYREQVEVRKDLRGKAYYWIGGPALPDAPETQDTDCAALRDGLVSVTPLDLDLTSRDRSGIWRGRHLGGFANVHSRDAGGAAAIP